MVNIAYISSLI